MFYTKNKKGSTTFNFEISYKNGKQSLNVQQLSLLPELSLIMRGQEDVNPEELKVTKKDSFVFSPGTHTRRFPTLAGL